MAKKNKKRTNHIRNLITICALSSIVFIVATYAWFIGMRTVNVSSFDVEISSTDSLLLSLDGKKWDTTVTINEGNHKTASYTNNSNTWGGAGLIPMSSVGEMDNTASRMMLYEKSSLTASPGGYRLMASRVNNYMNKNAGGQFIEQDGYVAFDLFIRNFSGTQYLTALNEKDEEAIYLTTDSEVKVATGGVEDTGIENSVRVAFAQIGRVSGVTTNQDTITSITCADDAAKGITGICRTAQIWEPNDKAHVDGAINWYSTSCVARKTTNDGEDGEDVTDPNSFAGECKELVDGEYRQTYAVNQAILSSDNVDIYDGTDYNGYTYSITNELLDDYDYFTDSEKLETGTDRDTFITLAPNSITKVRVYVYIEGQDVDNYDFASIGKKISVAFGFTKERFTEDDFDYEGPADSPTLETDTVKPVITLLGEEEVTIAQGETYVDAGATAVDKTTTDGAELDITTKIQVTNPVDTSKPGTYTIVYRVSDWAGNYSEEVFRTVTVTPTAGD